MSEATVKTHVTHIPSKLKLRDRVQAAVLAYESGLSPSRVDSALPDRSLCSPGVHDHQRERGGFSPEATAESGVYDCRGGTGGEARRDLYAGATSGRD